MSLHKPSKVIKYQGYNRNRYDNKQGIETGNSDANQDIQGKNAECHYGNGKPHGKNKPFQPGYLSEEDQCPGKAGQKEHQYYAQNCSHARQGLK